VEISGSRRFAAEAVRGVGLGGWWFVASRRCDEASGAGSAGQCWVPWKGAAPAAACPAPLCTFCYRDRRHSAETCRHN
jgi:hypothetical protein